MTDPRPKTERATFAAGCFWGVEEAFRKTPGVVSAAVGYAGGHKPDPSYKDVCTGLTGHAEVVEIEFDPGRVSYPVLLKVFFGLHDPTSVNRQGPDVGTQYRSAVFYHSDAQKTAAEAAKAELDKAGMLGGPVATEIIEASVFYRAEEYHQEYLRKEGGA